MVVVPVPGKLLGIYILELVKILETLTPTGYMLASSGFASFMWGIIYRFLLKWSVNFWKSWTSTGYFSNSTGSSATNRRFFPDIHRVVPWPSPALFFCLAGRAGSSEFRDEYSPWFGRDVGGTHKTPLTSIACVRFGWCHFSDPPHFGPLATFFGFFC